MKKNKSIKLAIIAGLLLLTVGCTQYVKVDNEYATNETTGQKLTANILCKPTSEELYEQYEKYEDNLTVKLEDLPSCDDFKFTDLAYVNLWESIFVKTLAWLILKVGSLVKNYGLSVIIISLLIRACMIPLTKKSMAQSQNMQKVQKEMQKLELKYEGKTDQDSMMAKSQEMMALYKKYNINPMSGCLTSLIQLPILYAFLEAINRVPAIFEDTLFGMNLGMTPSFGIQNGNYFYIILIILIVGTTYMTFKLSMAANQSQNEMNTMMYMMIAMIGLASLSLPTALAFYWISNNIFALVQTLVIQKGIFKKKEEEKEERPFKTKIVDTKVTEVKTTNKKKATKKERRK